MSYYVDLIEGTEASVHSFSGRTLRIGRGTNVDVRLEDPSVALEHAVIEQREDGFTLRDHGSVTGTFVNDERIESRPLQDGDRIDIGSYRLRVEVISPEDPLFLHASKLGDSIAVDEAALSTLRTFKVSGDHLLSMVEAARRTVEALGETETDPSEDSFTTMAAALLLEDQEKTGGEDVSRSAEAAAPGGLSPAPTAGGDRDPATRPTTTRPTTTRPTTTRPPATRPTTTETPARAEAPAPLQHPDSAAARPRQERAPIDYARAYRLERGLLRKSAITALFALTTAGALWGILATGKQDLFSPGPLTSVHRSVTNNACDACHGGFEPVTSKSCQSSGCHQAIGEHQPTQERDPSCLECHTEHRDLQALRLLQSDGGCVACHGLLRTSTGTSRFAGSITGFGSGEHPGFTPREDPGALAFNHAWHLRLPASVTEPLECETCHLLNEDGEVDAVVFEEHCQRCHNLSFDLRFGQTQAPHASPDELLTYLAGFYARRPEVLGRLRSQERGRLRGGLSQEEQLTVVAEWNARSVVRNKCTKCHTLEGDLARSPLDEITVRPTRLRDRWLEHAAFSHTPHIELEMTCDDCHDQAAASQKAADVVLPAIDGCRSCHRPAQAGESPSTAVLGRIECIGCHTYHPEPNEI